MAETSTMMPLGTAAPAFDLETIDGQTVSIEEAAGKPLLVMFLCNHCPYVKHVERELGALGSEYIERGVSVVAIASNDVEGYPDDGPDGLREQSQRAGFTFPYVLDTSQEVAKAYGAACTPDFFLFDRDHRLVYRGRLDASRPRSDVGLSGDELRAALDAVLDGREPSAEQHPSMGCSIKWRDAS